MRIKKRTWFIAALVLAAMPSLGNAQGFRYDNILLTGSGASASPVRNATVAVCWAGGMGTTSASVTNGVATLTMSSNPQTSGFSAQGTITVSGFTGADNYFNGSFVLSTVTSTAVTFNLSHANATASTNGTVVQTVSAGASWNCAPYTAVYTDQTLATLTANPFQTDAFGNYGFADAPGTYNISFVGVGVVSKEQTLTLPCVANSTCPLGSLSVSSLTVSGQIASTVATGTAPFSIASTTVVPNLNAQLHNGLTAPASAIVGISDTQTLTNKSLITTSSGDSVTSLNAQASGSAVVGTGSAVTLYTYSLPGSTVANLKGFRVNVGWIHNTGSAVVTYNLQLNGVNVAHILNSAFSGNGAWVSATVLNTGSTTGTVVWSLLDFSLNQVSAGQATTLTGLAWSSSQTLQFTFSVANTDQVTPIFWNVELIQ